MARPLLVAAAEAESGDRAIHGALGRVAGPDPEPLGDARAKRLEHDVGAAEQPARECALRGELAHHRLLPGVQQVVPLRRGVAHRISTRLLDPHHPRAESKQLARGVRAGQVPGQIDHEHAAEGLHSARNYHYPASALSTRATGAEEKRRLILDAAVCVFARKGFHSSRVGDIAEEAGVAHGLLYHYFSSKDEVLETIFSEHWTALLDRIHEAEASSEPPIEQLRGIVRAMFSG